MRRYPAKILKKSIDIYLYEIMITYFQNDFFQKELIMAKVFQFQIEE